MVHYGELLAPKGENYYYYYYHYYYYYFYFYSAFPF